ncbi:MAG: hypothetical protein HOV94_06240 [Saccharothrix sp.]|nr:hypothetical protein [Saccharothrix sp.]
MADSTDTGAEPGAAAEAEARRMLALATDVYTTAGGDADPGDPEEFVALHDGAVRDATYFAAEAQAQASLAVVELLRELLRRLPPAGAAS